MDRPNVDSGLNKFYIVDEKKPINGSGDIASWQIDANTTDPVQLVIYRPTPDGKGFAVVGKGKVETPALGLNNFVLTPPIKVKEGDLVGAFHPKGGAISFAEDPSGKSRTTASGAGVEAGL